MDVSNDILSVIGPNSSTNDSKSQDKTLETIANIDDNSDYKVPVHVEVCMKQTANPNLGMFCDI